jgi:hypothetical protein
MTDALERPEAGAIAVWLSEWQATEEWVDVHVGQRVAWTLTQETTPWVELLFDGARGVDLVLDTYAHPSHSPVLIDVAGVVRAVEAVSCRHAPGGDYERGSATVTAVRSTLDALPFGPLAALEPTGFILTLDRD